MLRSARCRQELQSTPTTFPSRLLLPGGTPAIRHRHRHLPAPSVRLRQWRRLRSPPLLRSGRSGRLHRHRLRRRLLARSGRFYLRVRSLRFRLFHRSGRSLRSLRLRPAASAAAFWAGRAGFVFAFSPVGPVARSLRLRRRRRRRRLLVRSGRFRLFFRSRPVAPVGSGRAGHTSGSRSRLWRRGRLRSATFRPGWSRSAPVAPAGPVAPVAPAGPVGPVAPDPPPPPLKHVGRAVSVKGIVLLRLPLLDSKEMWPFSSLLVTVRKTGTTVVAELSFVVGAASGQRNGTVASENHAVPVPCPSCFPVMVIVSPGHP